MSAVGEQAPPILLVDDERGMKESLDQIVKDAGFDLHYAESAEAALRLVEDRDYLMVISDVRLGGMSGQELLESLHADPVNIHAWHNASAAETRRPVGR